MGYAGACNEGRVGIGTAFPVTDAKVTVFDLSTTLFQNTTGVFTVVSGSNAEVIGTESLAGVIGPGPNFGPFERVIGVSGIANVNSQCFYQGIGIHGSVGGGASCNEIWAGFFEGDVFTTASYLPSDEILKTNISDLEYGLEHLMNVETKRYNYLTEENPTMGLPTGSQIGVIAQNIQEVMPELTREVNNPIQHDEEGNIIADAITFTAVNYDQLIPVIIKATQEQQAIIESQQQQIQELINMVENCCQGGTKSTPGEDFEIEIRENPKSSIEQNYPNPFRLNTRIDYSIACACNARIVVYNKVGEVIDILFEGSTSPGTYSVEWDASNLSNGVYFYTLEVDGLEMVKKAIKF